MKTIYTEKIGEKTYIRFIADTTIDKVETRLIIEPLITPETTDEEYEKLFNEHRVPALVGPEAVIVEDIVAEPLQRKLAEMSEHQRLTLDGEYDSDYRDVEYWIKKSGKWKKEKIEEISINLPAGAVLMENLTQEQNAEIAAQRETERIAGLSPEEKAKEMRDRLHVLAREAIRQEEEAELLGEEFDKQAWLQPKREEVERLYA